ncbi:MAG: ATP-grasp protein, partial [Patescibacteria group bacterium]|nr:ATP-grasp protein [Patescibacteria group bacterium]
FPEKGEIPTSTISIYHYTKGDIEEKATLKALAIEVMHALDIKSPTCIDIIQTKRGFVVVNIDTHPSLSPNSRFMQALSTTGVDVGHYVQSRFFL